MNEELYRINQKSETRDLIKFQLCGTTFPDKNYLIRRSLSDVWCIEYVEEGCGVVQVDDETFYPRAGDSYFLHAGKRHFYHSDRDDPWKKHFINFSGKLVDSLVEGYGLSEASYFEGLDLGEELKQIIDIAKRGEMDNTPEIISVLNLIFFKMRASIKKDGKLSGIGAEMKDFLNTQITEKFHIGDLCRHISRSESQTIRLFKKIFGITPYTYVLGKKIGFAKKLLVDTNLTVKEIATKLCFSDEYYFSNIFKAKTGLTPSQYRRSSES
ncbi:MAG: helix-turn-helix transcriptional regulator [Clostridia bacterium]|nr:helix-turn-helix transcriptional regulator [Clostridia bacterium]